MGAEWRNDTMAPMWQNIKKYSDENNKMTKKKIKKTMKCKIFLIQT